MKQLKRNFVAVLTLIVSMLSSGASAANSYGLPDNIQDGNILHCFDWTFTDIQSMLPQIAQAGFGAVQVSPVQGNAATNAEWFYAYMPYDFTFKANGNGSRAQLQSLCTEAAKYGIKIVVDVVANHVNQASSYHDTWWDSNSRVRWNGAVDYNSRYSITHGQLGEYGDVNSEASEVQARAKAFIEDLKSLGVKGIRWDAAKHIGLPSEGCDFWSTVTSVSGMWHYGEILDGTGGDTNTLIKEYANYMSVTDNGYSNECRNSVCNSSVPGSYAGYAASTLTNDKVVYWGESHDDYANDGQYGVNSSAISQDKIDRAWAIASCRNGATGLYFSRPAATSRSAIKMGQKGSTHFTSSEIAAINHLRNAAVGTEDYYTQSNGVACITRNGVGAAIIVGAGGSRQVSVTNGGGYVPAGTYTDEVSGNTFTVTASTISGQVGSTGIAVIYDATAATQPSMTFTPASSSFRAETLSVTATLVNATSGWYKIGTGSQTSFTGTATFTIGAGVDYGQTITVSWSATGTEGTKTGTVTYTKLDPAAVVYVYYNNPSNWSSVNAYIYKEGAGEVAAWPGSAMTKQSDGLWRIEVPEAFTDGGSVIFNNGSDQYPGANQAGLAINGSSMICRDNNTWQEYTTSTDPEDPEDPEVPTEGFTIYWDNSNANWATPYIHYWGGTSQSSWPGVAMTKVSGNIWKYDVAAGTTGVLFNAGDGDASKTSDFTATANHVYTQSGDQGVYGGGSSEPEDPEDPEDPEPIVPQPVTEGTYLITDYYKVNPNGQVGTNKTVNVSVSNMKATNALTNWTASDLIAQGVARDVCQAFKGKHERPIVDSYALYAAYDSQNLYLGVQYVYTIWDEYGEGYQPGESKPYNFDGDLMLVFDLDPTKSWDGTLVNGNSVWKDAPYTVFNNGADCMWHGSPKPGVGVPGLFFPNSTGKADYNDPSSCKKSNVTYGYADGLLPSITAIYGQKDFGYDPSALEGNTGFVDLRSEVSRVGGNDSAHTFYEYKIPLVDLGITENYIKQQGIGVMVVDMYGASAQSTLPYDPSMFDNVFEEYSLDSSTSMEKEDHDIVTYGFARIGKLATSSKKGDIDGDGSVSISDITSLIDALVSGLSESKYDIDGDGEVTVSDVTTLIDIILSSN